MKNLICKFAWARENSDIPVKNDVANEKAPFNFGLD